MQRKIMQEIAAACPVRVERNPAKCHERWGRRRGGRIRVRKRLRSSLSAC